MNLKQTYRILICTLTALILLFVVHATAYSDETPEWLYQRHYVDVENTRYFLEFYPLPYGPGHNFNAWMVWREYTIYSPQPPIEYLFLGPIVSHGGETRMGGMLDGFKFVRAFEGTTATSTIWLFKDGIKLTTEDK